MVSPWWILVLAVLGALAGGPQRAAVLRHSVDHGRPPRTHCPSCAARLAAGRLAVLPPSGNCPSCAAALGPPPFSAELITALLLAALAARAGTAGGPGDPAGASTGIGGPAGWSPGELAAFSWLAVLAVPLAFVDLAVHRLPDRLTLPAWAGTLAILAVTAAVLHRPGDLLRALLGGCAVAAFYLALFLVHPAGIGLGDAKLGLALGGALGWLGWGQVLAGLVLTHLLAGLYAAVLVAARRARRDSEIPFGPFMIISAFAVLLAGPGG
ncbi:A24 family peptidase [Planomonospora alba]|uniref:A24 family peptidase n=1 Tax=Planomonospora alba TaxID=161354 RepID=A0ABP6NQH7_9ACTN